MLTSLFQGNASFAVISGQDSMMRFHKHIQLRKDGDSNVLSCDFHIDPNYKGTHMKDLQEATVKICELKDENLSQLALLACLVRVLPIEKRVLLPVAFEQEIESARTMLLNSEISDHVLVGLETSVSSIQTLLASQSRG